MKINSNVFDFSFFLSNKREVSKLEEAKTYGGATISKDGSVYSNVPGDDFINVKEDKNTVAIFVPSTLNVNEEIDNSEYVISTVKYLLKRYSLKDISFYNTKGSWYSEDKDVVVIEKITVVEVELKTLTEIDIHFLMEIANKLKRGMNQEGISLKLNDSLAIV